MAKSHLLFATIVLCIIILTIIKTAPFSYENFAVYKAGVIKKAVLPVKKYKITGNLYELSAYSTPSKQTIYRLIPKGTADPTYFIADEFNYIRPLNNKKLCLAWDNVSLQNQTSMVDCLIMDGPINKGDIVTARSQDRVGYLVFRKLDQSVTPLWTDSYNNPSYEYLRWD